MTLEFEIRRGARSGERESHDGRVVTIGRHPLSDLRFDAERDRDVSARHAEIRIEDGRALLVDVGSTNGTYVNGRRITGPTALASGDRLSFGVQGPEVRITVGESWARPSMGARAESPPATVARPSVPSPSVPAAPRMPTLERVRVAVRRESRRLAWVYGAGVVVVAVVGGGAWWQQKREADAQRAELAALLARQDSLTSAFDSALRQMTAQVGGLDSALLAARREGAQLRAQVASGGGAEARSRLLAVQDRYSRIITAAQMDYGAVVARSGPAVALIAVEMPDGKVFSGSGFSVSPKGLVVTNRHLLRDEAGAMAKRVAVIFADTKAWLPARVVKVAEQDDLGFLQLEGTGHPAVVGIGSGTRVGAPVAIVGYPLGTDTPMEGAGTRITARSTLGAGTVSKTLANVVQVDAFAGQGSSGSPVFDAEGRVVAVVYGGASESAGRIVYAVPAARVLAELPK